MPCLLHRSRLCHQVLSMIAVSLASCLNAAAQDYSLAATYGDIELESGFIPDPFTLNMTAGGTQNANSLGNGCVGMIADAPDLQLSFEGGDLPLYISATSAVDVSLVVNSPSGNWFCDDDSAGALNPILELRADSGIYDIWVGTVNSDAYTDAVLLISELGGVGTLDLSQLDDIDTSTFFTDDFQGQILEGELGSGDDLRDDNAWQDIYTFEGEAGQYVVADMRSAEIDTLLEIISPSGTTVTNDDYGGSTSRSLISITLDESGQHTVVASSYSADESGDYVIGLEQSSPSSLALDSRYTSTLSRTDARREGGQYVDTYTFNGVTGQQVTIDLSSPVLDTLVMLESPSGEVLENDDTDRVGHSVLSLALEESGSYAVHVTSYDGDAVGDYALAIFGGLTGEGETTSSHDTINLALGATVTGSLSTNDQRRDSGQFVDYYSFDGNADDRIRFDLRSGSIDTYLALTGPDGTTLENDDYESSTSQSVIDLRLTTSGRYMVTATSYREGETGEYQIAASTSTAVPTAGSGIAGSQVFGIFVGISDYSLLRQSEPGWGDLSFTAEDAVVARDALIQRAGMDPANAMTLLDSQATVENVTSAFQSIQARITPDDTFVFFYSGHGGQELRSSGATASDADGYDETLALADATITDDQINALLDTISSNTSLIILDSCFSGGFAKDVISRPGRMGLFSSDEDVPSLVASKFRAGGYLSHFFREAIDGGNADIDRDSFINAMELSQYIHLRYSAETQSKGPSSFDTPDFGYQHLVADRGGVAHDAILFALN